MKFWGAWVMLAVTPAWAAQHPISSTPGSATNAPNAATYLNEDIAEIYSDVYALQSLITSIPAGNISTGTLGAGVSASASLITPGSGVFDPSLIAGSAVISVSSSTALTNAYNGDVIKHTGSSAWTDSLPQVGTSGITANAFQMVVYNFGTGSGTIAPTTSTINGAATLPVASGAAFIIFADGANYTAVPAGSNSVSSTFTSQLTLTYGQPIFYIQDTGMTGANQSLWGTTLSEISGTPLQGVYTIGSFDDGATTITHPGISFTRSKTTSVILSEQFGDSSTVNGYTFPGGPMTVSDVVKGYEIIPTTAGLGSAGQGGINAALGNGSSTLGFFTNMIQAGYVDASQNLQWTNGNIVGAAAVKGALIVPTGSATGATGQPFLNSPATGQIGIGSGANYAALFDANANTTSYGMQISAGTLPTLTETGNCSNPTNIVGGINGGSFVIGTTTGGVCTFVLTWPSATVTGVINGIDCEGNDLTQGTKIFQINASLSLTNCSMKTGGTTTGSDIITWQARAF